MKINSPELIISRDAFSEVSAILTEINTKSIGEYAFEGCFNLENLELGKDIEEIKSRAFWGNKLTDINLPENLRCIGTEAFYAYSEGDKPKKITIPESVEIIGTLPLSQGASSLSSGKFPAVNSLLQDYECALPVNSEISGYYGTEAHNYTLAHNIRFSPLDDLLFGDANGDGKIAISDMVSLQNYLLKNSAVGYEADLNKDGRIDVFDMVSLRKTILNIR